MAANESIFFHILFVIPMALGCRTAMGSSGIKTAPSDGHASEAGVFHYDEQDGLCKDASGTVGFNQVSLDRLNKEKGGECGTFTAVGILNARGIADCGGRSPCQLEGWDFRGADLNSLLASGGVRCGLDFKNADLKGAHMDKLRVLYACIEGDIDSFTKFVSNNCDDNGQKFGCCVSGDRIKCIK